MGNECEDDYGCDVVLRRSVKKLHFGSWGEKEAAAAAIKRAAEEEPRLRKLMAELGVIPALVDMVGSDSVERRRLAVQALVELAHGSYTNKALMVEAGILSKLPKKIDITNDESTIQEFLQLILSVTSSTNYTQLPKINSSRITPFVISILETKTTNKTIDLCLGTLHVLSSILGNSETMVKNDVITKLLRMCSVKEVSETALAILGNLIVTGIGKRALEEDPWVPECLIEVMAWEEKPKCQELAVYILMILAHQSRVQREKMVNAGIVPILLEVALLSSPLAQKRAMKLLQWFKSERNLLRRNVDSHSGPQMRIGELMIGNSVGESADEGKRLMKKMVKQSLHANMETITRRANCSGESSMIKALAMNSSSKSLPY